MPPLSESSKEQREEDEESGFGDLSELDLQVGAHREETVGSHAEPPAPRTVSSPRSSSSRHDLPDDDVASKLETDLRLSEDDAQEPDQLVDSPAASTSRLHTADATPTYRHQTDTDLTFEPLPYSSPADLTAAGEDWSNPPVTVEISASQGLSPEDGVESADSSDSTSSDTDNEKIELILPETTQDPPLAPNTTQGQTSPVHTPLTTPAKSHTLPPTQTRGATPVPTPDRIREGSKRLERLCREREQRLEKIGRSETCLNELITRQWDNTTDLKQEMSVSGATSDSLKSSVSLVLDRADTSSYPLPPATPGNLGTQSQATLPFKKRLRPTHDPLESTSSYDMTPSEGDRPPIRLSLSLKKTDTAESAPPSPLPVSIPLSTLSRHSPVKLVPKIKVKTPNKRPISQPNHISIKKMKLSTDSVSDSHAPLLVSIPLHRVSLLPLSTLVSEHNSDVLDDTSSLQDPFPEVTSSQSMEPEVREELLSTPKSHKSKQLKSTSERSRKSSTSPKKLWSVVSIPLHKLDRKPVHPSLRVESSLTSEVSSIERVDIGVGGHHEYLCPMCKCGYDGSLMICCDGNCTDTWYHGKCVGIFQAPETDQIWFCPECRSDQTISATERKKHKKHKKHRKYRQSHSEAVSDTEQCSSPSLTQEA